MDRKQGLDDLATRLSAMVNELPNDGPERAMTVTVGGDNHGNITFGNHITINAGAAPVKEERPLSDAELRAIEQHWTQVQRRAWLRSRINVPSALMLSLLVLAAVGLLSGVLLAITPTQFQLALLAGGGVFIGAGAWATRISRLEQPLIEEARHKAAVARQARHRRRVM